MKTAKPARVSFILGVVIRSSSRAFRRRLKPGAACDGRENRQTETLAQIFANHGRPKIGMRSGRKYVFPAEQRSRRARRMHQMGIKRAQAGAVKSLAQCLGFCPETYDDQPGCRS